MDGMVRRLEQNMGADAMRAATGRDHEQWRDLLTEAGAMDWDHPSTARWLVEQHGVDGWWAQGITVDFEQARKGRLPGQQKDGTFSASITRTIPGSRLAALQAVAAIVTEAHGEPHGQNLAASIPVIRWRLPDGTRLAAAAQLENTTGTPINLTLDRLGSHDLVEGAKKDLLALLDSARDSGGRP